MICIPDNNGQDWAIITGCTDGIGRAFAFELNKRNYNLLLISRNSEKLEKLSRELKSFNKNVTIEILEVDFRFNDQNIHTDIKTKITKIKKIKILINNVSICSPENKPQYFDKIPDLKNFIIDIININVVAMTRITALVIPGMLYLGDGYIINMSSISAISQIPFLSLYSGTKAYIDNFSRGLDVEYSQFGIRVQSFTPYYISTKMSNYIKTNWLHPHPDEYVKSALNNIGIEKTSGYLFQDFYQNIVHLSEIFTFLTSINLISMYISNKFTKIKTVNVR